MNSFIESHHINNEESLDPQVIEENSEDSSYHDYGDAGQGSDGDEYK
jgi:hypothetical protein